MNNKLKLRVLSVSIGIIFFYFGFLKLFPNASPAEALGINTVSILCFEILSTKACIISLALLELAIGLSLITGKYLKWGVIIGIVHLIMTFTPLVLFPEQVFAGICINTITSWSIHIQEYSINQCALGSVSKFQP